MAVDRRSGSQLARTDESVSAGEGKLRGRPSGTNGAASCQANGKTCGRGCQKARDTDPGQASRTSASKAGADRRGQTCAANGETSCPSCETISHGSGETTRPGR